MGERDRNLAVVDHLAEEIARHRGQYVTIRDGRVVAYSPTFEQAFRLAEDDPHALVFEAGRQPVRDPVRLGARAWPGA